MLYLIRTFLRNNKSILKVGYARKLRSRINDYIALNPGIEFISSRQGDLEEERLIHVYLKFLGFRHSRKEWYVDDPGVLERFHDSIDTIKAKLWKHRDEIFPYNWWKGMSKPGWESIYKQISVNKEILTTRYTDHKAIIHLGVSGSKKDVDVVKRPKVLEFIKEFSSVEDFPSKMKILYDFLSIAKKKDKNLALRCIPKYFRNYYAVLGPERISKLKFNSTSLKTEFRKAVLKQKLRCEFLKEFSPGEILRAKEIKQRICKIYSKVGVDGGRSSAVLKKYFTIVRFRFLKEPGRPVGYKIIDIL